MQPWQELGGECKCTVCNIRGENPTALWRPMQRNATPPREVEMYVELTLGPLQFRQMSVRSGSCIQLWLSAPGNRTEGKSTFLSCRQFLPVWILLNFTANSIKFEMFLHKSIFICARAVCVRFNLPDEQGAY